MSNQSNSQLKAKHSSPLPPLTDQERIELKDALWELSQTAFGSHIADEWTAEHRSDLLGRLELMIQIIEKA